MIYTLAIVLPLLRAAASAIVAITIWGAGTPILRHRRRRRLVLAPRPPSRSPPTYDAHIPRCQPVPNFPRLRALALFGRRPAQCAERVVVAGVQKPAHKPTSEGDAKTGDGDAGYADPGGTQAFGQAETRLQRR
jgi:hypothetical protein